MKKILAVLGALALLAAPAAASADPKAIDQGFYAMTDLGEGTHILYSVVTVAGCPNVGDFDVYLETTWQDGESTPATIQADRAATVRAWAVYYECPLLAGQIFLTEFAGY